MKTMPLIFSLLLSAAVIATAQTTLAAGKRNELPRELPSKTVKSRFERQSIPSNYSGVVVKSSSQTALDAAIEKSKSDLDQVNIVSRKTIPAPEGDLAELLPTKPQSSAKIAQVPKPVAAATQAPTEKVQAITPPQSFDSDLFVGPRPQTEKVQSQTTTISIKTTTAVEPKPVTDMPRPYTAPAAVAEAMNEYDFEFSQPTEPHATELQTAELPTEPPKQKIATTSTRTDATARTAKNSTIAFFRAGYLKSHYSDFDSRMKDGATSIGFGAARGIVTDLGLFEARASIDIYHAIDQSISIETVRMVSTRTEATYWFTEGRVKPGLSLALGWAEYSVRTYHHAEAEAASELTVRTHAQSQAFTVIPGTALRVELGEGLMIDVQTEYMALLGGDSSAQIQGLGANLGLGWLF
jgi:microcompartment protein CcmL/EutN